jgi:hypothetical protein
MRAEDIGNRAGTSRDLKKKPVKISKSVELQQGMAGEEFLPILPTLF